MVRRIYPSPGGIMTAGYIYNRATKAFIGYRYQEYAGVFTAPDTLATILLANRKTLRNFITPLTRRFALLCPTIAPDCATSGNSRLKEPSPSSAIESRRRFNGWAKQRAADQLGGHLRRPAIQYLYFIPDGGAGARYSPDGRRRCSIGKAGFAPNELLAPEELSWVSFGPDQPRRLTVAGAGNRTWVQFDSDGPARRPIDAAFPATTASRISSSAPCTKARYPVGSTPSISPIKPWSSWKNGITVALTHYETRRRSSPPYGCCWL
jgi:hypothetical protein